MPVGAAEPVAVKTPRQSPVAPGDPSTLTKPVKVWFGCAKPLIAPFISEPSVRQPPSTQSTPVCVSTAEMVRLPNDDDSRLPVQLPATLAIVGSGGGPVGTCGGLPLPPQLSSAQIESAQTTSRMPDDIYRPIVSEVQTCVRSHCIARLPPGPDRFGEIANVSFSTGGLMESLRSVTRPRSASGWCCV